MESHLRLPKREVTTIIRIVAPAFDDKDTGLSVIHDGLIPIFTQLVKEEGKQAGRQAGRQAGWL
jgi:hypothetical protein